MFALQSSFPIMSKQGVLKPSQCLDILKYLPINMADEASGNIVTIC